MILAIDPGPKDSAFCYWDGERVLEAGIANNEGILVILGAARTETVVCEHLQCFGMAVGATVFETAYWIGHFRCKCSECGLSFARVMRGEVKMHHCGSMRAKDSNIRQALIDRFGVPGTKKNPGVTYGLRKDIWSAFAIATMVFDKSK
jgi:hypothetical protein